MFRIGLRVQHFPCLKQIKMSILRINHTKHPLWHHITIFLYCILSLDKDLYAGSIPIWMFVPYLLINHPSYDINVQLTILLAASVLVRFGTVVGVEVMFSVTSQSKPLYPAMGKSIPQSLSLTLPRNMSDNKTHIDCTEPFTDIFLYM